jgi:hypothetical protein
MPMVHGLAQEMAQEEKLSARHARSREHEPTVMVFHFVADERTRERGDSALNGLAGQGVQLEPAPLPDELVEAIGEAAGTLHQQRASKAEMDWIGARVRDYLDSHAETVPTDLGDARALGEAAGVFAASALRSYRREIASGEGEGTSAEVKEDGGEQEPREVAPAE